jgi:hypothetical protein
MQSPSQSTPNLQRLESEMQELVGPFINDPDRLPRDSESRRNSQWSVLDHLEYVFHVNLQLLVHLHALPDADQTPSRSPTLWGRIVLLTGLITADIDRNMADYVPGELERARDYAWLREHFGFWNDKLAGLHFLPEGWQDKVVNSKHPTLGYLTGADWIRLMHLFTRYHRKKIK